MGYYPVMLDMRHASVLVVGSGIKAAEKVRGLKEADARIEIFDEVSGPAIQALLDDRTTFVERLPDREDFHHRILAIGAHRDAAVNQRVQRMASEQGVLVNVVDVAEQCHCIMMSQLRRGDLVVAVSTSGRAPGLARRIRLELERQFDDDWDSRLTAFSRERQRIRASDDDPHRRQRRLLSAQQGVMEQWQEAGR